MKSYIFEKPNINDFYFYNKPTYYSTKDYNKVLNKIVSKYFSDNIKSIYTWGSVSAPGISDIDIIIVLNKIKGLKRVLFNKKEKYIMCHPFFIIDEAISKNIRFIYPNLDLKLIKGGKININLLKKDIVYYVNIFLSIDIAVRHFPRDYMEMLLRKRISIRDSLLRLNALSQSLTLYKELSGKIVPDFESFIRKITFLRKNWFDLKETERNFKLLNLLNEAIIISLKFVDKLRDFIIKENIIKVDFCDKDVVYTGMRNRTFFIKNWQAETAINSMINFYKDYRKFYSYLPVEFAPLMMEYSKNKGVLSEYIKKSLEVSNIKYKVKGKKIIDKRIFLLNKQAEISLTTRHSHFVAFFDYGFKSKHGLLNRFMHLGRKIKDSKIYKKVSTYKG